MTTTIILFTVRDLKKTEGKNRLNHQKKGEKRKEKDYSKRCCEIVKKACWEFLKCQENKFNASTIIEKPLGIK